MKMGGERSIGQWEEENEPGRRENPKGGMGTIMTKERGTVVVIMVEGGGKLRSWIIQFTVDLTEMGGL